MMHQNISQKQIHFCSTFLRDINSFPSIDIIDVGDRQQFNRYIEFVAPNEFKTSAGRGVDCYDRPFVCLKMLCTLDDGRQFQAYQTMFQRYSDNSNMWVPTGNSAGVFGLNGNLTELQRCFIIQLLKNKKVEINDHGARNQYGFCTKFVDNDTINLWEKMTKIELVEFDTINDVFIHAVDDNV